MRQIISELLLFLKNSSRKKIYVNNVNQTKLNRKLRRPNLLRQERKFTRTGSRVTSAFLSQSSGGSLLHVTKNKLIFSHSKSYTFVRHGSLSSFLKLSGKSSSCVTVSIQPAPSSQISIWDNKVSANGDWKDWTGNAELHWWWLSALCFITRHFGKQTDGKYSVYRTAMILWESVVKFLYLCELEVYNWRKGAWKLKQSTWMSTVVPPSSSSSLKLLKLKTISYP